MALTQRQKIDRRGPAMWGNYGYPVAPGEQIWGGGIVAVNSSGYLQRVQTAGSVCVVGVASRDYNNTASSSASPDYVVAERGIWGFAVTGASYAGIDAAVYAVDDNTLVMAPTPIFAAGANTGNGTITGLAAVTGVTGAAKPGAYTVKLTSSSAFTVTDPNGDTLAAGTVGTAYNNGDISFTVTAGGTAFVAGDSFTIDVGAEPNAPLLVGTLNGFDKGTTYVRIKGS